MDVVEKALNDRPDRIVLVDGSSNMPQIFRTIAERTGYYPKDILVYEPSKTIAKGAAVYAKLNFTTDYPGLSPKVMDMPT